MWANLKVFLQQNKLFPDMPSVRFLLIGCGQVAKRHLEQITETGELIAVCDTDVQAAEKIATQYKVPFYTAFDQLVCEVSADVAVVCTPNGLHADHAVFFLEHGFHVLIEKPMALSVKDAERMITVAKKQQLHLFTVLQNRFNPAVQTVYKAIQQNDLGKIFSVQVNCFWNRGEQYYTDHAWHGKAEIDGGILFTQCSHFIDLLRWCFGPVKQVSAMMHNANHTYTSLTADEAAVILRFENGVIGTLHVSVNAFNKNMEGSLLVLAEKGTVKIGGTYLNTVVYRETASPLELEANQLVSPLSQVYLSMIRTLQEGEQFYANPEESLEVIKLIEQIHAIAQLK